MAARGGMTSHTPAHGCKGRNDLTHSSPWLEGEELPHTLHPMAARGGMTSHPPPYAGREGGRVR